MDETATGPWREALQCVDQLLSRPESEREPYLAELAVTRPDLCARVRVLLDADAQASRAGFMNAPAAKYEPVATLAPEARLGPWRIVRQLGKGGMGEVWLARRDDGLYEGEVAIKTLHPYFAHGAMRDRFLREAQLLGKLTHPNIARLHDAGVERGIVYLVLEYVRGEPLDVYCDSHSLSLASRLKLLTQVCNAVAHAHANLVVHRDLKPSNILVTADGQVKLLDFGIGKLVEAGPAPDSASTELTRVTGRVFTPEYAAPEQILGQPVTTATDTYSLGVLFYQLLSGKRPHGAPNQVQVEHAVVHEEAGPLAQAARDAGAQSALARGMTVERLQRALTGDLENIVQRALRKLPEERYASVPALVDDVRRYERHEPVLARVGSRSYRFNRFLRRHRVGVAASVGLVVAAAVGVTGVLLQERAAREQANIARLEAEKATAVKNFLLAIFDKNNERNPDGARARETTALELLTVASENILAESGTDPDVRDEFLTILGGLNRSVENYALAQSLQEERLRLITARFGPADPRRAGPLIELSYLLRRLEKRTESVAVAEEAVNLLVAAGQANTLMHAKAILEVAQSNYEMFNRPDPKVKAQFETAVTILENYPESIELPRALTGLARAYEMEYDFARMIPTLERSIALAERSEGPRSVIVLTASRQLARALAWSYQLEKAEEQTRKTLELAEFTSGPQSSAAAGVRLDYSNLLMTRGKHREAAAMLDKLLADADHIEGGSNGLLAQTARMLFGRALYSIGNFERAREVLDLAEANLLPVPNKSSLIGVYRWRALVSLEQHRESAALADLEAAWPIAVKIRGPRSYLAAAVLHSRGEVLTALRRYTEARTVLAEASAMMQEFEQDPEKPELLAIRLSLMAADLAERHYDAALVASNEVLRTLQATKRRAEFWVWEELAQRRRAALYQATGNEGEACRALEAAIQLREANALPQDPRLAAAKRQHAACNRLQART